MTQPLSRVVLALAGVMAVFIGGALLVSPHAFFAMNHIELGDDPNLLSEIRAPGGLLLAAGAIMIAGVAMRRLTRVGLVTAAVVYCSYGASRLLGILLDGAPSSSLIGAMMIELVVGVLTAVLVARAEKNEPTARQ